MDHTFGTSLNSSSRKSGIHDNNVSFIRIIFSSINFRNRLDAYTGSLSPYCKHTRRVFRVHRKHKHERIEAVFSTLISRRYGRGHYLLRFIARLTRCGAAPCGGRALVTLPIIFNHPLNRVKYFLGYQARGCGTSRVIQHFLPLPRRVK